MAKLGTKANGIYYLDVQVPDGSGGLKRSRVGCQTRDRSEAEKQLREWKLGTHPLHFSKGAVVAAKGRIDGLIASVKPKVRQAGMTMEKLFDRCWSDPECWAKSKSQATIRSNIKLLNERIGDELVATVTRKRLKELVEEMQADGYAPGSIKRKMDMISKALRMAAEEYEDDDGNPLIAAKPTMPRIKVQNEKSRVLSDDEEAAVFQFIDARVKAEPSRQWARFRMFIRVLLDTGFRRGEALILGPQSVVTVSVKGRPMPFLSLPQYMTKNDKPRMVPCTAAVASLIPALNSQAVDGRWFPMDSTAWYMWDNIRRDVKVAGGDIDDVGLHTLRHTCITRLALGEMELQRLSMWAGHSDVSITAKRYSHLSAQALAGGVEILGTAPTSGDNSDTVPEMTAQRNGSIDGAKRANPGTARLQ